jgi:signal transduction histidine kinase
VLDLIALLLLIYFTGGIESPLYMLFVFHMIIGSLILPGFAVYLMAFISYILLCGMIMLEYFGVIPHHHLYGLLGVELSNNLNFIGLFMLTFGFMILISVYLANGIAKQLYKRERDLYDSLIKINAAEKEKQKYIMGIVHELKTPLAAISSYLDLVLQKFLGPISEEVEEKIARAKFRSDEGIGMINDVLNVSKLKLYDEFDEEDVNLAGLVAAIIRNRKVTAEAHLISLTFNDERTKKEKIRGDKFLLNLAISNLIGNSIKYGVDEGNVVVTLRNKNGSQVLEVCDDGIGIPKEDLEKIFRDFYRSSNAKKISTDGSGLGLSVVKQVIERHRGTIKAESPSKIGSMSNPGTCFTIQLPIK